MLVIHALTATLLSVLSVNANIYTTYPVASSVLYAGRSATVSWINDNTQPALQDMGPVKLELYNGNDTFVASLADGVEPTSRSQQVWIAPTWAHDGSDYYMRFVCNNPELSVYTARFSISHVEGDVAPVTSGSGSNDAAVASLIGTTPALVGTPPAPTRMMTMPTSNSTAGSTIGPTPSAVRSTSIAPSATSQTQTQQPQNQSQNSQDENENSVNGRKTGAGTGIIGRRSTVDLERVKFRLVFILWPALVGITMAL
ncbi:hypothetical protein CERSUDRAFT_74518 [Gelatoporia subvermispora B]|uniref:Yeast cell wall synthesis Kre9/Knh1-like N-terminal domain-containing protein n=1 Tax=Ceriporiopsis subvermispora (strain B) TaxID=914234 RepID=M2QWS3_CERS8|nr:hypothetical protein CERSUDRAFT_74518 [Gelatoporia subvermispora B]